MKAGIITFHRAINYGAALQAYALKSNFERIVPCEVVNYISDMDLFGLKVDKSSGKKLIKTSVKYVINRILYRNRIKNFRIFNEEMKHIGEKTFKLNSDEKMMENEYDFFVVGSDQVFCPIIIFSDYNYLLSFVSDCNKKYSYAASFGALDVDMISSEMMGYLSGFNFLSIRETQDASTLSQILDKPVEAHVDPVFLHRRDVWEKLAIAPKHDNYILIYTMRSSNALMDYAVRLSQETGAKIVHIPTGLKRRKNMSYEQDAGPREFLGLLLNARYVLTNSFHATAFSLILHKQVAIEMHTEKNHANHRFETLINLFNISDRVMSNGVFNIDAEIDFQSIDSVIECERNRSLDYLEKIYNTAAGKTKQKTEGNKNSDTGLQ